MIEYGDDLILVRNIREENIIKCVEARRMNQSSFFGAAVSDEESEKWISRHREDPENILLEIIYRPLERYIGTVGYVFEDSGVEVGRMSIYTPAVKELINSGVRADGLHRIMETVCSLTIGYLFENTDAELLFCNVIKDNRYSNAMCARVGGVPRIIGKEINGQLQEILHYEMTRTEYLESRNE